LKTSCLNNLESMVIRQQHLVRHIWLNIELPRYRSVGTAPWMIRYYSVIQKAVSKLLFILSAWQTTDDLTLELSVSSPSGSQNWFKDCRFGSCDEGDMELIHTPNASATPKRNGLKCDRKVRKPFLCQEPSDILGLKPPIDFVFPFTVPQVPAVTALVIRRQLRQQFLPGALGKLLDCLPRLNSIVYERWRDYTPDKIRSARREFPCLH
jgi:hypothetical protein